MAMNQCEECGYGDGVHAPDCWLKPRKHVNYPHEPGRLYDCPACEAKCHCTPGDAECVFEGEHSGVAG